MPWDLVFTAEFCNHVQCMPYPLTVADVDECDEGTDSCAQICTNTIGSYDCSCNVGYRIASDNHMCDGKVPTFPNHSITYVYSQT